MVRLAFLFTRGEPRSAKLPVAGGHCRSAKLRPPHGGEVARYRFAG